MELVLIYNKTEVFGFWLADS